MTVTSLAYCRGATGAFFVARRFIAIRTNTAPTVVTFLKETGGGDADYRGRRCQVTLHVDRFRPEAASVYQRS